MTNSDGRVPNLLPPASSIEAGTYRSPLFKSYLIMIVHERAEAELTFQGHKHISMSLGLASSE